MRAILLGPPGAGKGTQAERICGPRGLLHLSTGDLLRAAVEADSELGRQARGFMDRGELVPDSLVLALLRERLDAADEGRGFLLDGFPRNVAQARALEAELDEATIDHVVYLQLDDEEILRRLLKRGRPDDTEEVIRRRLEVYRAETEPLVAYFRERGLLRDVDALGTIDEIQARVDAALSAGAEASGGGTS
ncbi:MAG: adenylate kinase [Planctomycetota bacterium]|jgi:adenylate kinase